MLVVTKPILYTAGFLLHKYNVFLVIYLLWSALDDGGPGSSVSIATDYGLDSPGPNPGGDEIFRPSRPVPRPTQPPVK